MFQKFHFLFLIATLAIFSPLLHAQVITRGPYMTSATPGGIVIQWRTDVATTSRVKYGLTPVNLNNTFDLLNFTLEHKVTLVNLVPDTKYYYSIGTMTQVLQGDTQNYFKTNPISSPTYDKPINFWAVGDMGKQTQQQINVRESFKKYIDTSMINGWIMLGDNAYPVGADADYQNGFFNYYQNDITRHIVLWPCLGNHDYANDYTLRTNHLIPYLDIFALPQNAEAGGVPSGNGRYYSYDYGNIHFVNLDSYGLELVNGNYYALADTALSPQAQWLKTDLTANNLPWVIVSFHHPPYCMITHNSDAELDLADLRTRLNPILERFNVDLVMSGHCHSYQRTQFMRNHFGLSASFDSNLHIIQNTSGKYDTSANSCPYIKNNVSAKDSGVIYMVIGSGSAIPQLPFPGYPHKAMYYSNYADNGSLLIHVEGNRLNATWVSTDTAMVVKDHFTIIKKANRKIKVGANYPSVVTLKAGWYQSPYAWSTGDTSREIVFNATKDTVLTVTDLYNCIADTFEIVDSATLLMTGNINKLVVRVYPNPVQQEIIFQLPEPGQYQYTLSDETGTRTAGESFFSANRTYTLKIPGMLPAGNYFLRLKNARNQIFTDKITVER